MSRWPIKGLCNILDLLFCCKAKYMKTAMAMTWEQVAPRLYAALARLQSLHAHAAQHGAPPLGSCCVVGFCWGAWPVAKLLAAGNDPPAGAYARRRHPTGDSVTCLFGHQMATTALLPNSVGASQRFNRMCTQGCRPSREASASTRPSSPTQSRSPQPSQSRCCSSRRPMTGGSSTPTPPTAPVCPMAIWSGCCARSGRRAEGGAFCASRRGTCSTGSCSAALWATRRLRAGRLETARQCHRARRPLGARSLHFTLHFTR